MPSGRRSGKPGPANADKRGTFDLPSSGDLTGLRVIAFPGAPNLPIFAAIEQGMFRDEGLDIALSTTPSSV